MAHRQMSNPAFRQSQEDGIRLPHVAPINALVDKLRDQDGRGWVPYVAPIFGGIEAEMLHLFRDPGPMTNRELGGSGFLCLENDDPAAERFATLLDEVKLDAGRVTVWNSYPWYINRKPNATELDAGVEPLRQLLEIPLARVRVVMLNGGEAKILWRKFSKRHPAPAARYDVIPTYHTANQAFIGSRRVRDERMAHLRSRFSEAASILNRKATTS
jgi:hypothetical protein